MKPKQSKLDSPEIKEVLKEAKKLLEVDDVKNEDIRKMSSKVDAALINLGVFHRYFKRLS